jgi:MSHA biogenesis protein MshL
MTTACRRPHRAGFEPDAAALRRRPAGRHSDPSTGLAASTGFSLSNAAATAGSMFGLAVQTSNFAALISFLETQGTVHVLSSPRVAA